MNARKLTALVAICTAAAMPSWAGTVKFPYYSPMYRMGTSANDSASTLTTTPKLAFSGMTLADMAARIDNGYWFGMTECGTSWIKDRHFHARDVLVCRNPDTDAATMISVLFVSVHDGHTKSLAVELTDGDGGVYARAARAQYLSKTSNASFPFVAPDGNGGVIYSCDSSNATKALVGSIAAYNGAGYGCCSLTFAQWPKTSAKMRIFANAPGEPVLTVEDIKDYSFSSLFCGYSVAVAYIGTVAKGYNNTVLEYDNGRATKMTVDFQMNEGNYTKCVVIEFTNGEDGVYAQAVNALHAAKSTHPLGTPSTNSGWTLHPNNPTEYYAIGASKTTDYGVFTMNATPPASAQPKMLWNKAENMIAKTHKIPDVSQLPVRHIPAGNGQ